VCLLVVMGGSGTRPRDVPRILAVHREQGRWWSSRRFRIAAAGAPVVAKVAGVKELWITGVVEDGTPLQERHPEHPDLFRYAYRVAWAEPARRGVPVASVLGEGAVRARQMIRLSREDHDAAYEALHGP